MMTFRRSSGPLYISPTNKMFLRPEENKENCINVLGLCYCRVVLTVHQPCILVCIGNSTATAAILIGKHMCTRFYCDWLLFSLHLQSGSSPSKYHPLTTVINHILSQ